MAVSIMTAFLTALCLLTCSLQVFVQAQVFGRATGAHAVFLRSKRANQFLVEEILQGNLERECYEELCNYEEAREVFENDAKTISFWTVYYDGDQCVPNPCLHGGNCTDKVGGFTCSCSAPYHGRICELGELEDSLAQSFTPGLIPIKLSTAVELKSSLDEVHECPTEGPTACHQLCTASRRSFKCSCMAGFKLQSDGRSCEPEVKFPCGRPPDADTHRHGDLPWQVDLVNSRGERLCSGVVLGRYSILTAARCLLQSGSVPRPSDFTVIAGNSKALFAVRAFFLHDRFELDQRDNDLALVELADLLPLGPAVAHLCLPTKDFCENILMHAGSTGVAAGRGRGLNQDLVYMNLDECRRQLNVSYPLSNKMFCMRNPKPLVRDENAQSLNQSTNQDAAGNSTGGSEARRPRWPRGRMPCGGLLPGSPVATAEKGTVFLTGLLISSSDGCDGHVFTKVSRYLNWLKPRLQVSEDHMTPQVSEYPGEL